MRTRTAITLAVAAWALTASCKNPMKTEKLGVDAAPAENPTVEPSSNAKTLATPGLTPISGRPSVDVRPFEPQIEGKWAGNGISYGPYRKDETPDGDKRPPKENILEDLKILSRRWHLIRTYGWGKTAEDILEVIRDHELPVLVMQGAWISKHQTQEQNDEQVNGVIDLANRFPNIVVAVNIGNEIFVDWSAHKVDDPAPVIEYLRKTRAAIKQPVTVNDDYNFWNKPHSKAIADEVDFIGLHGYAFWNNKTIDEAAAWTEKTYRDIQAFHPEHVIAYCETGWPTSRITGGDSYEGGLIGKANEENQQRFFDWYDPWIEENRIISLYFEAFDEPWKGGWDGDNPAAKAEKHWGLYGLERKPKAVLQR